MRPHIGSAVQHRLGAVVHINHLKHLEDGGRRIRSSMPFSVVCSESEAIVGCMRPCHKHTNKNKIKVWAEEGGS